MTRIMLVDDSDFMRGLIKTALLKKGFPEESFTEAHTGDEAIGLLAEKPDLVILDIAMPGIDGIETLKKMREQYPDIKCIMCSSRGQEKTVRQAFSEGALDFIVKPFREERLAEAVEAIL